MKKKMWISVVAIALVLCCAVGGTLAWLSDKTDSVVNTFTVGDINITLTESDDLDLKMVPGKTITKDPKVTVKSGSEACWLFVKVEKSANFDAFMTYEMADGWTALTGEEGVYYREATANAADTSFDVLKGNQVAVKETVTKEQLQAVKTDNQPTLTFTAYAVQKDNIADAAAAWEKVNP